MSELEDAASRTKADSEMLELHDVKVATEDTASDQELASLTQLGAAASDFTPADDLGSGIRLEMLRSPAVSQPPARMSQLTEPEPEAEDADDEEDEEHQGVQMPPTVLVLIVALRSSDQPRRVQVGPAVIRELVLSCW
jgi:hypothetical protein